MFPKYPEVATKFLYLHPNCDCMHVLGHNLQPWHIRGLKFISSTSSNNAFKLTTSFRYVLMISSSSYLIYEDLVEFSHWYGSLISSYNIFKRNLFDSYMFLLLNSQRVYVRSICEAFVMLLCIFFHYIFTSWRMEIGFFARGEIDENTTPVCKIRLARLMS